jgi:fimbrial chaperone protein
MRGRGRRLSTLVLLLALLLAAGAQAALVAIDPVKVLLTGAEPSKSVSLRNNGTETLRFQLSAFTWQQSTSGEMQLAPTQDVVFFPSLLELAPGETRRVRVTTTTLVAPVERSYRLFVDELPPLANAPGGAIRVLTRFGLPVFQLPDVPSPQPALKLALSAGKLSVTLENHGNSHFLAQSVRIVGRGADGSSLIQQTLPAWYVLAGGKRSYDVALAPDICPKLAQVSANANTDHGATRVDYPVAAGACTAP